MTRSHHICLGGDPPPAIKEQLVDVQQAGQQQTARGQCLVDG